MLSKEEIREIKDTDAFRDAFTVALNIHRDNHEPGASHFRNCVECKSGFALLLLAGLKQLKKEQ